MQMTPDKIQKRALATWDPTNTPLFRKHNLLPAILGIAGETGELVDLYKKDRFKLSFIATTEEYLEELGDVLYYVAILAYQLGVTLDKLSKLNRQKLEGGKHGWKDNT